MLSLPELPRLQGVFLTGTDTDVGKTTIAAGLTAAWRRRGGRVGYFKPIQSGAKEQEGRLLASDALLVKEVAGLPEELAELTPVLLRLPLAPAVAARLEGQAIEIEIIKEALLRLAARYDFLVVEGAGGLYVPLIDYDFLVLDLARWLRLPLIVVARAGLGTINHTVLTVKAAEQAGIRVLGVILNKFPAQPNLAEQTNPEVIAALTGRPILGRIPVIPELATASGREALITACTAVLDHPAWQELGG